MNAPKWEKSLKNVVSTCLTKADHDALYNLAYSNKVSVSEYLRSIIVDIIEEHKGENPNSFIS